MDWPLWIIGMLTVLVVLISLFLLWREPTSISTPEKMIPLQGRTKG